MAIRNQGRLACETCRTRRIKCNQLRPQCSQCVRAGLVCFGYRSAVDLAFQDQTAYTRRKYHKTESGLRGSDGSPPAPSSLVSHIPLEEIAWWYYFENFNIIRPSGIPVHCSYLSQTLLATPGIISVGLAALAVSYGDPHLMQLARQRYSLTLKLLMRAINDSDQVRLVTTATTSFNLAMFEMITYDNLHHSPHGWLRHMHGTTALLHHLKLAQHPSLAEVKGLLQITYTAPLACLISGIPTPNYLVDLLRCGRTAQPDALLFPLIDLFTILCRVVNLHHELNSRPGDMNRKQAITATYGICHDLESWISNIPAFWIDPIRTGEAPRIDDECWIMRVWVYYRLCRFLAHKVIADNLENLDPNEKQEYENSKTTMSQTAQELYIGIPAMFGASHIRSRSIPSLSSNVFFVVTVLQTMATLTPKGLVVENWSSQVSKVYGRDFAPIQGLILRRLN